MSLVASVCSGMSSANCAKTWTNSPRLRLQIMPPVDTSGLPLPPRAPHRTGRTPVRTRTPPARRLNHGKNRSFAFHIKFMPELPQQ